MNALFTDFYELTMAQGYWKENMNDLVVFDVFFRRNPFNGGFSVFAGSESLFRVLKDFSFSDDDINFLREQNIFEDDFLSFLKDFHFSGDIYAIDEGSIVFPQEPLLRIHAPLIEAQIIEGLVLNYINYQSLIATKTCRMWNASKKSHIMEFGLRRAQGTNGAISATRASFIGGASSTSNTLAAKEFGIRVSGTMAHSWIMSHENELQAFREYAKVYPENSIFLLDTYDTLKSGIKNAIIVGKELKQKGFNFGVRLDSGDISYLTKQVRSELDKEGLQKATIAVSNDLTEEIIQTLVAENAPIDSWGIGTNLVTGGTEAAFSGVYKLCARFDKTTKIIQPTMKFSDNPTKTTNPGVKNVYRLYDENNLAIADILTLENEKIECGKKYIYFHPMVDYREFEFTANKVEPLLKKRFENGKPITPLRSEKEQIIISQNNMKTQLETFDDSYKRILNPHVYKVSLSQNLATLKKMFIQANVK